MKKLLIFLISLSLVAAPVKKKTFYGYNGLKLGENQFTSLSLDGEIKLSREVEKVADLNDSYIWDMCTNGTAVFFATGEKGKIYSYTPGGPSPSLLTQFEEGTVYSLAVFRGKLYAGLSPEGALYEIDIQSGKKEKKLDLNTKYIWQIVSDNNRMLVSTGMPGKITRIDKNFLTSDFATGIDDHIQSLDVDGDTVYAGTSPSGYILKGYEGKQPFLLADTDFSEVKDILYVNNILYAACFNGSAVQFESKKVKPAQEINNPQTLKGALITVDSSNLPVTQMTFNSTAPYSLGVVYGQVCLGTGHSGKAFMVDPGGNHQIAGEVDAGQITDFITLNGSVYFSTSNSGQFFKFKNTYAKEGDYISSPIVNEHIVKWGRIYFEQESPNGSRIENYVRFGNSASPNVTWTSWKKIQSGDVCNGPDTSRMQWKVRLISHSEQISPVFNKAVVYFRESNYPPEIKSVTVCPPGICFKEKDSDSEQTFMTQDAEIFKKLFKLSDGYKTEYERGMLSVVVTGSDVNRDPLLYTYFIENKSGRRFNLKADSKKEYYSFSTENFQEGTFRLGVTVTDREVNYPDEKTVTEYSEWIVLDNTPPVMMGLSAQGSSLNFTVSDSHSVINMVQVTFDGGETWQSVYPEDGLFDSKSEQFTLTPDKNATIRIRFSDDKGNGATALLR